MAVSTDHALYLQRHDFACDCLRTFGEEERAILIRYGRWMEALASGALSPTTPEQVHFLQAARGECAAQTPFERAWAKLAEHRLAATLGAPVPADAPSPVVAASIAQATIEQSLECLAAAKQAAEELRERFDAERAKVLEAVAAELAALDARYAEELEAASQAVAERESELKAEVLRVGRSVRRGRVQAIFSRGRVTWDGKGLARYAEINDEMEQFRRVGRPTVSVRYH